MADTDLELERLRLLTQSRQRQALAVGQAAMGAMGGGDARLPQGAVSLGTFADNGVVYQLPDGSLGATSAGGSTTDPATVQRIMEGQGFARVVQSSVDQQRIAANPIAARANEFNRGAPFVGSYLDEAVGLVSPQARDNMRATTAAMQRENPGETAALNIAGGVAGSIPMAVAAGPSVAARMASSPAGRLAQGVAAGAVAGGAEGAVYGYGEGTDSASRASQAGQGAAWGAVLGGVIGGAAGPVSAGLRNALLSLRGRDENIVARTLGVSVEAGRMIRDALRAGGVTEAVQALRQAGPRAMLADAGTPARVLLDASVQSGGNAGAIARQAIGSRTRAEANDITAALDRVLGAPQGERELIDSIRTGTQPDRRAAYGAAYGSAVDFGSAEGQEIAGLLRRVPQPALRRAQQIMEVDGVEFDGPLFRTDEETGDILLAREPEVEELHLIMQGLDDVVQQNDGMGRLGGQTALGSRYQGLRRQLSRALEGAVPEFGVAQRTAADAIGRREAVETGYNLLRDATRREDVARALQGATDAERAAARQGLRAYIDDMMARVGRTQTDPDTQSREAMAFLTAVSDRANQTKLRILLGQNEANALISRLNEAATAFNLRAAINANSATAVRSMIHRAGRETAEGGPVRSLMRGNPVDATKLLTQAMTGETDEAVRLREMGLYEDIARALTGIQGPDALRSLRMIERAMRGAPLSAAQAERIATTLVLPPVIAGERLSLPLRERGQLPPPR